MVPMHIAGKKSLGLLLVLSCIFLVAGCRGGESKEAAPIPAAESAPPGPPLVKIDAESLAPVIREIGRADGLPDKVVFEFSRPIVSGVGEGNADTVVHIAPPVPGSVHFIGPSSLAFYPSQGFSFGTQYTLNVVSVQSPAGKIVPPASKPWTYTFTTPAFAFLRSNVKQVDFAKGQITLGLVFSGPVNPDGVKKSAQWKVNAAVVREVRYSSGADATEVTALLRTSKLALGATVDFELQPGVSSKVAGSNTAAAAQAHFQLSAGKRIDITRVALKEGANGFYIEVGCRESKIDSDSFIPPPEADDEAPPYEDEYGSPDSECVIDEDSAADFIVFKPKTAHSVAPTRRGFRVFADLHRGSVALTINPGLTSTRGGILLSPWEKTFSIPARKAQLTFGAVGRYLPRAAWKNLAVNHLNVDAAELTVRHVPQENLVFWLSDLNREAADERTSNLVATKVIAFETKPDTQGTSFVDLSALLPSATKGLVEVTARSTLGPSPTATSRILLTDLSLIAKRMPTSADATVRESVKVWALGIDSTELLSGVEMSLVKRSGQVVARCTTAGTDGCTLRAPLDALDPAGPFAVLAKKGDDFTYLRYADLQTEITEANVSGEPFRSVAAYRAATYTDRGVYRPGETAHVVAVVRTQAAVAPPAGLPVQLAVTDSRGREMKRHVFKTNEAGIVTLDLPFEAYAETGKYGVEFSIAGKKVAESSINVEEFVPERMKVAVKAEGPGYGSNEEIPLEIEAAYLFGGSAEGSKAEVACRLEASAFHPAENAQFHYGVWAQDPPKPQVLGKAEGALDAQGHLTLKCPAPAAAGGLKGPAQLIAQAAVFEAGSGRSTQASVAVPVHPERYYVGLQSGTKKAQAGKAFSVTGVVVDWKGKPVADVKRVEIELLRLEAEYDYWWTEGEGERYQRRLRPVREGRTQVEVKDGTFETQLTPSTDGAGFVVRARSGAAQTDLELEGAWRDFYWGGEQRVDVTPKPLKPTSLLLKVNPSVRVGESATLTVQVPYRGKMLFTAETDEVLASEWRAVEAGEQTWNFPVKAFAPNIYLSALLVKDPHLESAQAFMPDRAFGVTSVSVEPVAFTQTVKVAAPKEVRSHDTLEVAFDVGAVDGPTFATVAAVDEGILSLTRFRTPDLIPELFVRRALGVETYETLGWTLLVPPAGTAKKTGGSDTGGAEGRVQPVKPVALWSGLVKVGDDGKAKVRFEVPQYRGQLRVMVVTAGPKRVGSASTTVVVRDPITLQTTMPRFLSYGDRIEIPVFVTNVSGKAMEVSVALKSENLPVPGMTAQAVEDSPLELLGKAEGRVKLEDGKSGTLVFQARAGKSVGAARLTVVAKGGGFESRDSLDVPFSPSGPRERLVQRLELAQGTTDLKPHLQGWVPTTEKTTIWVTQNPYGEAFDQLKWLIQYPYGCIEQTTSTTRPLLFVSNLLESIDPTMVDSKDLEKKVSYGINRIFSMQTPAGGFSYWPGQTEPMAWGTAYAAHMLLDAQKAGFAVPQDRLDRAIEWAGEELTRYENASARRHGHYQDHEGDAEPYLHYVLALTGKGRKASIAQLIDRLPKNGVRGQAAEHSYMLKAALYLAGDRRYEKDLRAPDVSPLSDERFNSWSFYSDRRRRGFMLSTFHDLFGADPAGEPLAQMVASGLTGHGNGWYTTQEVTWGVTGLGKRLGTIKGEFSPPVLLAGKKSVEAKPNARSKTPERTFALARASEYPSLALSLDEAGAAGKVFAIVSSEGVRQNASYRYGGSGLKISRTYRTLEGAPVDVSTAPVALAQMLFVEIEVSNTTREVVRNLAMVDRLPAGWEIENPRLGRAAPGAFVDQSQLWDLDFLDVRDDRIAAFGSLEQGQSKKFIYAVRAVTAGTFTLPPVEIEAMYNPDIWAREAGGTVEVASPWADFLL